MIELTNYTTYDGDKIQYVKQESYTHIHIVIRKWKMMYDKGAIFIFGVISGGTAYCGIIRYYKDNVWLETIYGTGISLAYKELNNDFTRIVLKVNTYSVYTLIGNDPFEVSRTNG